MNLEAQAILDQLGQLSPGACKLLWVYHCIPDASDAELRRRTGYSQSQCNRLKAELRRAGLHPQPARTDAKLSFDQLRLAADLRALGVTEESSRQAVVRYPLRLVEFAIAQARQANDARNRAGLVITIMRRTYRLDRTIWGTPGLLDGPEYATPTEAARATEWHRASYVKAVRRFEE